MENAKSVSAVIFERKIYLIRNQKVMLSHDLAELYGIPHKVFNQAITRNTKRFPADFMFTLSIQELSNLRSQFVTSSWGGNRYKLYAFTEQGIAMLSSVLNSDRAIAANIEIIRAFVRMRELISSHKDLLKKLEDLENKYDVQFKIVFDAIKQIMNPPIPLKRQIGIRSK